MKKRIGFLFLFAFLTIQCSSSKSISQQEARKKLEQKYKVPIFSSPEVQDYAYEFLVYIEEIAKNKKEKEGDYSRVFEEKSKEFIQKHQETSSKMTSEDIRKFVDWSTKIAVKLRLE